MSKLIDPISGLPIGGLPQKDAEVQKALASLAYQQRMLQEGLFHLNILTEFVMDQVNTKLKDSDGYSPIDINQFDEFFKNRSKEVMAMLKAQAEASTKQRTSGLETNE